jgi:hypothetical protein
MLLCDWVLRPHSIDRGGSLAGLLENFSQLLYQPIVGDVRFTDGCQHRPHGALRHAKPAASFGNFLVRSSRRGFDQRPHLLPGEADCDVGNVYRFRVNFAELYSDVGRHGDHRASYFANRRSISARVSSWRART